MAPGSKKKKAGLTSQETSLVQGALVRIKEIPANQNGEKAVIQIHRIRKSLIQTYRNLNDPEKRARKIFFTGLLISLVSIILVSLFAILNFQARFNVDVGSQIDAVTWVIVYSILSVIVLIPLFVGIFLARRETRRLVENEDERIKMMLLSFDVAVVKGLLRADEQQHRDKK